MFRSARATHHASRITHHAPRFPSAFTLLELMIVVGIMGLIAVMGVPIVYKVTHRTPMTSAIRELEAACSSARARAILSGQEVDLVIHPRERRFEVGGAAAPSPAPAAGEPFSGATAGLAASGLGGRLDDKVLIEDLDINLVPGGFRDADVARVRFFPNGTCDEMRLFLVSDKNERCEIKLEVTTGLADVEHDVNKFR